MQVFIVIKIITMIQKSKLTKGVYYVGTCRNTNVAMWNGEEFIFINYFFIHAYIENIKYYGDVKDINVDGFIPIKEIEINFLDVQNSRIEQDYKNGARNFYKNLNSESLNGEIWKVIPDFCKYSISNYGRVKKNNTILKQNFCGDYLVLGLSNNDNVRKTLRVHRLVALTFLPDKHKKHLEVNHINAIKTDNRLINLEWVSHESNSQSLYSSGNHSKKLKLETVLEIKKLLKTKSMKQKDMAVKYNISISTISEINTGKKWKNCK
jgi:hypothetical protein